LTICSWTSRLSKNNHLLLRHFVHRGWNASNVQYRRSVWSHEERRFLYGIVPNADDQVCLVDSLMNVIARRERRGSHVERGLSGDRTLAHLGIKERDLYAAHKIRQGIGQMGPACRMLA
jgi:hypothetical protein